MGHVLWQYPRPWNMEWKERFLVQDSGESLSALWG